MDLDVQLAAIITGDARAFGVWMAGSEEVVRQSVRSFARQVDVEAVLQEALLRVWQVAPRFVHDGRPNGLLCLAIRIARNLAISEVRKQRATPTQADDLDAALANDELTPRAPDPMLREGITDCRDKLPAKPR